MDENKKHVPEQEEKSIWKQKHTPLKDRTSSSGITFWSERVEVTRKGGG